MKSRIKRIPKDAKLLVRVRLLEHRTGGSYLSASFVGGDPTRAVNRISQAANPNVSMVQQMLRVAQHLYEKAMPDDLPSSIVGSIITEQDGGGEHMLVMPFFPRQTTRERALRLGAELAAGLTPDRLEDRVEQARHKLASRTANKEDHAIVTWYEAQEEGHD